jgi:thiol-disulfide isomerase/thioredoxin
VIDSSAQLDHFLSKAKEQKKLVLLDFYADWCISCKEMEINTFANPEVNQELQVLKDFLEQAAQVLKPGGHLVVMSYHSLEDRLVKNFMKRGSFSGELDKDFFGNVNKPFSEVNRHPIVADEQECALNSRARSAKLRIAKRNG